MTKTTTSIISDDEIERVHGHANFGTGTTKRGVVNEGVVKYAAGYTSGHTQLSILLEHGLLKQPRPGRYEKTLSAKGHRYLGMMIREAKFSKLMEALNVKGI